MKYAVLNEAGDDHDEPKEKAPAVKEEPRTPSARIRKQKRGNARKPSPSARMRQKQGE